MTTFRLGGPRARDDRRDQLRGGAVTFLSPRGLGDCQRFLVEALPAHPPDRTLTGMDSEGGVAMAARSIWPDAPVEWFHLDAYVAAKVRRVLHDNRVDGVEITAAADLPAGPFDVIALPFPAAGESQLMWDLLEASHDALRVGGRMIAATDGKTEALRKAVEKVFRNVTPAGQGRRKGGAFYAERKREAQVLKDRSHSVRAVIRHGDDDGSTSLDIVTRPGTFAYRRLDAGTRALAEWLHPGTADAVLDLGAGCGALGLYAALRLPDARVLLVDSNARAIECAQKNTELLGVADRVQAVVRADLEDLPDMGERGVALALANPPYFSGWRIAESFAGTARRLVRAGGRVAMVVRDGRGVDGVAEIIERFFGGGVIERVDGYAVVYARAPGGETP